MSYEPPRHLRRVIASLLKGQAGEVRRHGYDQLAADLMAYADRLTIPERNGVTRSNALAAARMRRYRARQKEKRAA
jgi:hypothetical protein